MVTFVSQDLFLIKSNNTIFFLKQIRYKVWYRKRKKQTFKICGLNGQHSFTVIKSFVPLIQFQVYTQYTDNDNTVSKISSLLMAVVYKLGSKKEPNNTGNYTESMELSQCVRPCSLFKLDIHCWSTDSIAVQHVAPHSVEHLFNCPLLDQDFSQAGYIILNGKNKLLTT